MSKQHIRDMLTQRQCQYGWEKLHKDKEEEAKKAWEQYLKTKNTTKKDKSK